MFWPPDSVAGQNGGEGGDQSRVGVGRDGAIHEDRLGVSEANFFRREVGGRRGAGAHQLPERYLEIAVRPFPVVVFGIGVVGQRPRRTGGGIAHHDQQELAAAGSAGPVEEQFAAQPGQPVLLAILHNDGVFFINRGIFAVALLIACAARSACAFLLRLVDLFEIEALQHRGQLDGAEALEEVLFGVVPGKGIEHRAALADVHIEDALDRHAPAEAGGDDGAGAGSGEEVEVVAEHESLRFGRIDALVVLAQEILNAQ